MTPEELMSPPTEIELSEVFQACQQGPLTQDGLDILRRLIIQRDLPKARLSFDELRSKCVARTESVFHRVDEWSPTDWACALAGEVGEACNQVKKLRRLDGADDDLDTPEERERLRGAIAKELADTIIYADLLAARLDIDLGKAVTQKFNEVSRARGSNVFLGWKPENVLPSSAHYRITAYGHEAERKQTPKEEGINTAILFQFRKDPR